MFNQTFPNEKADFCGNDCCLNLTLPFGLDQEGGGDPETAGSAVRGGAIGIAPARADECDRNRIA